MEYIRVGVIGVGNIGSAHAAAIKEGKVNGMKLTALCDISKEKLDRLSQKYNECKSFDDYKKLIDSKETDAVIISVPHKMHTEIGIYALKHNNHVLIEKPVDISVSAAKEINDVASKTDKTFALMLNQRTNFLFNKAREIVKSGKLGNLKRSVWIITNWYRSQNYYDSGSWRATWCGEGGGVLLNQAPHNLDIWQWICSMPKYITAFCEEGKYHNIEVEDDATIFAQYENGATGTFITTTGEYPGTNRLEISGELGKLVLEKGVLKWWKLSENEREVCYTSKEGFPSVEYEYTEIEDEDKESGHIRIMQNFTNHILNGEELISPGGDGINELTISNAAYLSAWNNNKKIEIPFDPELFDKLLKDKMMNSKYLDKESMINHSKEYSKRWRVNW